MKPMGPSKQLHWDCHGHPAVVYLFLVRRHHAHPQIEAFTKDIMPDITIKQIDWSGTPVLFKRLRISFSEEKASTSLRLA